MPCVSYACREYGLALGDQLVGAFPIVPNGSSRACFPRFLSQRQIVRGDGLAMDDGESDVIIAREKRRCGAAAKIAIDAARIDVVAPGNVLRETVSS